MAYRILYVDDEQDNLFSFKAVFRRNYEVLLAGSGAEALTILEKEVVDLVISDQRMPEMTGVDLFAILKEKYPDTLRIILTGYSDMQAVIDAINKGNIYHYITKPWKAEEMRVILEKALEAYRLRLQNRELERKNIEAQFEILKNQINPHFLFNSMNILSALIRQDKERALQFTNRFSKLYRSMLELRQQQVISLEEEMQFVDNYLYLQKIRFDENLILKIEIDTKDLQAALPPFAIQLLVENAIKHNIVSNKQPLTIAIYVKNEYLIVANTFQPRNNVSDSTGTGLANLKARYKQICPTPILIKHHQEWYEVSLPLIPE